MNIFFLDNDNLLNDSTSWVYQATFDADQSAEPAGYVKVKCSKYLVKDDSTFITFVADQSNCITDSLNEPHCDSIFSIPHSDTETVIIYLDEYGERRQEILKSFAEPYAKSRLIDTNKIQYNGRLRDQYLIHKSGNFTNYVSGIGIVNGVYNWVSRLPCGLPGGCEISTLYQYELVKMNDKPVDISKIKTAIANNFKIIQSHNATANRNVRRDLLGRIQKSTNITGVIIQRNGGNVYKKSVSIPH